MKDEIVENVKTAVNAMTEQANQMWQQLMALEGRHGTCGYVLLLGRSNYLAYAAGSSFAFDCYANETPRFSLSEAATLASKINASQTANGHVRAVAIRDALQDNIALLRTTIEHLEIDLLGRDDALAEPDKTYLLNAASRDWVADCGLYLESITDSDIPNHVDAHFVDPNGDKWHCTGVFPKYKKINLIQPTMRQIDNI